MVWRTSRPWGETRTMRGQGWGAILLSRYYSGQHGQRRGVPRLSHWWGTMGRGRPSYAIKECLRFIGGVCGKDRSPSLQVCLPSSSLSFFLFLSPSFNSYIFSHFLSFATANFFTSEWSLWCHVSSEASIEWNRSLHSNADRLKLAAFQRRVQQNSHCAYLFTTKNHPPPTPNGSIIELVAETGSYIATNVTPALTLTIPAAQCMQNIVCKLATLR